MKIAIVGGGWIGCHLASKLMESHSVVIYEKNDRLFNETSYNNQNRLHLGFHYPRNYDTREMCKNTFQRFISDYGFLTNEVKNNLYCIPKNKSIVDFKTYKQIFNVFEQEEIPNNLNNIEGCINTDERYIDYKKASDYFNNSLSDIKIKQTINKENLKHLSNDFDLVINATNNSLPITNQDYFFEVTLSLIYNIKSQTYFDALTLMDGPFFSIYPYDKNRITLTDVEHTPLKKFDNIENLLNFKETIKDNLIANKQNLIEEKVKEFFPDFLEHFSYSDYFISIKTKIISNSDSRYPVIEKNGNVINCFSGKIQGIYIIEDYIKQIINENINR